MIIYKDHLYTKTTCSKLPLLDYPYLYSANTRHFCIYVDHLSLESTFPGGPLSGLYIQVALHVSAYTPTSFVKNDMEQGKFRDIVILASISEIAEVRT